MEWALLLLVTFFAATVQSATGFGFGLIAVSAFLILQNSAEAIQLVIIITLVMSCVHFPKLKGLAPGSLLMWLCLGCLAGFPLGILVYNQLDLAAIKVLVAVLIILISLQNGWHLMTNRQQTAGYDSQKHKSGVLVGVGIASGLMASSMAMPGPAVMLYLSRTNLSKNQIRSLIITFFIFSYGGALLLQTTIIGIAVETWITAAVLTPSALVGVVAGHLISKKINQQLFRGLVLLILLLTGLFMLINL